MIRRAILPVVLTVVVGLGTASALAAEAEAPKEQDWSFQGLFGTLDNQAAQRGFQVYKEICSACHSLKYVAFRHLQGIGLNEEQVKAIAADYQITDGPDEYGDPFDRSGRASDFLPDPYPNEEAAKSVNGGAIPPDLSLIAYAKTPRFGHIGADYIYSILTGYEEDMPADFELPPGSNYNPYFRGSRIVMPAPLFDDMVEYADGTSATIDQMSRDVATFLTWAADPRAQERKKLGFKVVLFLLVLTGLFYAVKRKVWADLH